MSIPESVIAAAKSRYNIDKGFDTDESTARRVILALVKNLPDSAVEKAARAAFFTLKIIHHDHEDHWRAEKQLRGDLWVEVGRAAIIAALKDIAGETP